MQYKDETHKDQRHYLKWKNLKSSSQESEKTTPKPTSKMDEHSCKENRTKSWECAGIHQKEVAPNSQEPKELVCSMDQQSTGSLVGNL